MRWLFAASAALTAAQAIRWHDWQWAVLFFAFSAQAARAFQKRFEGKEWWEK